MHTIYNWMHGTILFEYDRQRARCIKMSLVKVHSTADMHIFPSKFTWHTCVCVCVCWDTNRTMCHVAFYCLLLTICLHCDMCILLDLISKDTRNLSPKQTFIPCLFVCESKWLYKYVGGSMGIYALEWAACHCCSRVAGKCVSKSMTEGFLNDKIARYFSTFSYFCVFCTPHINTHTLMHCEMSIYFVTKYCYCNSKSRQVQG